MFLVTRTIPCFRAWLDVFRCICKMKYKYTYLMTTANYKATIASWLQQTLGPGNFGCLTDKMDHLDGAWQIRQNWPLYKGYFIKFKEEKYLALFLLKFGHLR